ncbi:MAG: PAS domain-containing protein [Spirulinaceae cyanobacterium SM2_1_0]|nr:PAS domain-containing protein [Spirulinaceae cyanobacterium SM2_1_0]
MPGLPSRWRSRIPARLPLRTVLVLPFAVQIALAVGLTGWLSLRNGERAIAEVTAQLRAEITARIQQQVQTYLDAPVQINQMNVEAVESGVLNPADWGEIERFLWPQLRATASLSGIKFGNARGELLGIERRRDGSFQVYEATAATARELTTYAATAPGQRSRPLRSTSDVNARFQAWYTVAIETGTAIWAGIYTRPDAQTLASPFSQPVYDREGRLLGVFSAEIALAEIGDFLQALAIGKTGQAFIIERSGFLVASSTLEQPFLLSYGTTLRLKASNMGEPLIQATAAYLEATFPDLGAIAAPTQLSFTLDGEPQFLQVTPLTDAQGLDWLIVVVVPEADFLARIEQNTRLTLWLCLGALVLSIGLGILTARWLTEPLTRLIAASQAMAAGQLQGKTIPGPIAEVQSLAAAFDQMSQQLHASFTALEKANTELEGRVQQRTLALAAADAELRSLFAAMTELIFVKDADGRYLKIAAGDPTLVAQSADALIGVTEHDIFPPEQAELFIQTIRQALATGTTQLVEYQIELASQPHWFAATISPLNEQAVIWVARDITQRKQVEAALQQQQQRSEQLLLNILPAPIAEQLKQGSGSIADQFDQATILFADIVGFTALAGQMSAKEVVFLLNHIFSLFDKLVEWHELEKVKTIGDAYMAVGGVPTEHGDSVAAIADLALDMQAAISSFPDEQGVPLSLRIGIHTGPVVAGVIGIRRFIYDLWGDTVNVASRMESQGEAGCIQVTQAVYRQLRSRYHLKRRGKLLVRGKGEMTTYWLLSRR